jgi:hypothetical protein
MDGVNGMPHLGEQRQDQPPRIRRAPTEGKPFAYCELFDAENRMNTYRYNNIARMTQSIFEPSSA